MGQWYSVEADLKFKDQDLFCECIKEIMFTKTGLRRIIEEPITPFTCFKALTSDDAKILKVTGNTIDMYCEFHASYGWQEIVEDAFIHAIVMGSLKDGSTISIYPDVGDVTIRVVDGKAEMEVYNESEEADE